MTVPLANHSVVSFPAARAWFVPWQPKASLESVLFPGAAGTAVAHHLGRRAPSNRALDPPDRDDWLGLAARHRDPRDRSAYCGCGSRRRRGDEIRVVMGPAAVPANRENPPKPRRSARSTDRRARRRRTAHRRRLPPPSVACDAIDVEVVPP